MTPYSNDQYSGPINEQQKRLCERWCSQIIHILTNKNPPSEYFDTLCHNLSLTGEQIEYFRSYLTSCGNDSYDLSLFQDCSYKWLVQYYPNDFGSANLHNYLRQPEINQQTKNLKVLPNQLTEFVFDLQANSAPPAIALLNKLLDKGWVSTIEILNAYKQIHCKGKALSAENNVKKVFNNQNSLLIKLDATTVTLSKFRPISGISWKLPDTHKSTAVTTDNFTDYPTIKRLLISAQVFTNNHNYTKSQILNLIKNGLPLTQPNFNPTEHEKAVFKAFQAYVQGSNNKELLKNIFENIGFSFNNFDFDYNER